MHIDALSDELHVLMNSAQNHYMNNRQVDPYSNILVFSTVDNTVTCEVINTIVYIHLQSVSL